MRVDRFRHQPVDHRRQQHPAEKRPHRNKGAGRPAEHLTQFPVGSSQEFDKGDVDHHPAGKSERKSEKTGVGPFEKERNAAADRGRHAGEERQSEAEGKFYKTVTHFSLVRRKNPKSGGGTRLKSFPLHTPIKK